MVGHSRAWARVVAALCVIITAALAPASLFAAPEGSRWGPNYFPNYEVVAHTGERFRFYEQLIENKLVLFHFIYTRCGDICPLQMARMKLVTDRLGDRLGKDVFVYTITLEPEYDTKAVLASLADTYDVPPGWLLLTGDPKELAEIRYKLGERSRQLVEHRHEMLWIGNDRSGRWKRYSLSADLDRIAVEVMNADPVFAARKLPVGDDYRRAKSVDISHQRGQALFLKGCAACHSIGGGDGIAPDLAGLMDRREKSWVVEFIREPQNLRARKDPTALALDAAFPVAVMPRLGLSEIDAEDVLAYIAAADSEASSSAAAPAE